MSVSQAVLNKIFSGVVQFLNVKYQPNEYAIQSFSIDTPCSAEDNFLSQIFSLKFKVKLVKPTNCVGESYQIYELIAKSQISYRDDDSDVAKYFYNLIFTKEKIIYTDILPRMENLLKEVVKCQNPRLAPEMRNFYTEGESYSCILLDNLISQGFYIPKTWGNEITLEECNSIMNAIARFHALSIVIESGEGKPMPEINELYTAEFFLTESLTDTMRPIVQGGYDGVLQLAETYRPDLVPLLRQFEQETNVWTRICELVKPGRSSFSCLCHGDARLNNVFLKKDVISHVYFIDFQLTRYASPLTDLQYILKMGATKNFRDKYAKQVLQTYFEEFTSVLNCFPALKLLPSQEVGISNWTIEKLIEEYEAMTEYGFLIAITLLPIALLRPGDIDKPVGEMNKAEREGFWKDRKSLIYNLGCMHADVREMLFDICDEAFSVIKMKQAD